jgi:hypothetical protein
MVYREPNFKIHVGTFPTASLADRELLRWLSEFPNAFVVQTQVPLYPVGRNDDGEIEEKSED